MLYADRDQFGITTYLVTNEQDLCLIRTTDARLAWFVERNSYGINPELRLKVGGDPGTILNNPMWTHVRRIGNM